MRLTPIIIWSVYLLTALVFYRKSMPYLRHMENVYREDYDEESLPPKTAYRIMDMSYIVSCLCWPFFGRGLSRWWKVRTEQGNDRNGT